MAALIRGISGRIREFFTTATEAFTTRVRIYTRRVVGFWRQPTRDWGRPDYAWWRKAYYARVRGLELSGLFIKPLVSKVSGWVVGVPPTWKCENETSQEALAAWWGDNHAAVLAGYRGALREGDCGLVINSDLSVTLLPGETLDPIVASDNFGQIIGWRVTQVMEHPTETRRMMVVDEYYATQRIQRIEIDGMAVRETVYPNLIDRIPLVVISNGRNAGDSFGHPEAEALLELFGRYGDVLEAAIEGNVLQGRPTPVLNFEDANGHDKFWEVYGGRRTRTLPDGTTESTATLDVDLSQLLTLVGGSFEYKSPGSFSGDTAQLLELLFYLFLEHAELPEFVMGNAIASSKASAETQMPVFERFIEARRGEVALWLIEIAEIVLGYLALMEPGVTIDTPKLQWRKLTQDGRLTLDTVTWAYTEGLLDRRTALTLAPVEVTDIDEVLDKAEAERQERMAQQPGQEDEAQFDEDLQNEINNLEI